jgi:hypothetical protein
MNLMPTLRTPYPSRAIVGSDATGPVDRARLGRAIVATQLVLTALCAARVGSDVQRGPLTPEGILALALLVALVSWLLAKSIAGALRR